MLTAQHCLHFSIQRLDFYLVSPVTLGLDLSDHHTDVYFQIRNVPPEAASHVLVSHQMLMERHSLRLSIQALDVYWHPLVP